MEKKKLVTTVTAVALLGALAIGGTLAYLTDTETKTNEFTINNEVDIELTEDNWDPDNGDGVTPNATVAKDPAVKNNKEEKVIVFLKVESPKDTIQLKDDDSATNQELFWFYSGNEPTSILEENTFNSSWVQLTKYYDDSEDEVNTYIFGYSAILDQNDVTNTLFDYVQLKNYIGAEDADDNPTAADIVVTAYAIQADNLYTADGSAVIDTSDLTDENTLVSIYETYLADTE